MTIKPRKPSVIRGTKAAFTDHAMPTTSSSLRDAKVSARKERPRRTNPALDRGPLNDVTKQGIGRRKNPVSPLSKIMSMTISHTSCHPPFVVKLLTLFSVLTVCKLQIYNCTINSSLESSSESDICVSSSWSPPV